MASPTGVEPVACPLGGDRSIQLSYGDLAQMIREGSVRREEIWLDRIEKHKTHSPGPNGQRAHCWYVR